MVGTREMVPGEVSSPAAARAGSGELIDKRINPVKTIPAILRSLINSQSFPIFGR
jgi:hypothetical protein